MIGWEALQEIANAQRRGYLKTWKAWSMVATLRSMDIASDPNRLRKYVANCLEMEGFAPDGIDAVAAVIAASVTSKFVSD